MGNSGSNGVYVKTDRQHYAAGEIVTGTVYCNIQTPIGINGLYFKVKGVEKTQWSETRSRTVNGKTQNYTEYYSGKRHVFKVAVPLANFQSGVKHTGQFQFPINFQLPTGIPGTMYISGALDASVSYSVKAVVKVDGFLKSNLRHSQPFYVSQPPPIPQRLMLKTREKVKVFCCFSKGDVLMEVLTDKNSYSSGEVAQLISTIDNQSSLKFRKVKVELVENLIVRDNRGNSRSRSRVIAKNTYPGIEPMRSEANRLLQLAIPRGLQQNSLGCIIQLYYTLSLRVDVPWGTDRACFLPVGITDPVFYLPAPTAAVIHTAPPGFNPVLHQPVAISVPSVATPSAPMHLENFPNVQIYNGGDAPRPSAPSQGDQIQAGEPVIRLA